MNKLVNEYVLPVPPLTYGFVIGDAWEIGTNVFEQPKISFSIVKVVSKIALALLEVHFMHIYFEYAGTRLF